MISTETKKIINDMLKLFSELFTYVHQKWGIQDILMNASFDVEKTLGFGILAEFFDFADIVCSSECVCAQKQQRPFDFASDVFHVSGREHPRVQGHSTREPFILRQCRGRRRTTERMPHQGGCTQVDPIDEGL